MVREKGWAVTLLTSASPEEQEAAVLAHVRREVERQGLAGERPNGKWRRSEHLRRHFPLDYLRRTYRVPFQPSSRSASTAGTARMAVRAFHRAAPTPGTVSPGL
ncbi:hypothetical protein SAMN00790413_02858 [Deinococcus hopiensis KR-140]|uniref:Uncharacterized protein n=1 Tax=Deinococcus hopiensis KR-140 TaxID=695939 RepID=A0A1W1VQ49_9DEIO|nr:hypothetical protein SAMN00790413_02858 [Deinococcus hopiensis KR-140]